VLCGLLPLAAAALAGCSGPVPIDASDLDAADRAACQTFLDDLPHELADEGERDIEPDDALGAAYGDPPMVVTCVDRPPAEFTADSACEQVNDVGWFVPDEQVADPEADVVLTALSHRPFVQVSVPADYRPEGAAAALADLAKPIADNLELVDECL
jgi:hypothetical protein